MTPIFQIRDLGVDNNVFDSVEDRKSDFTVTPTGGVALELETTRTRLKIESNVGYVFYGKYAHERGMNSETVGNAEFAFARKLKVFGSGSYADTRTRLDGEINARARRFITDTRGGLLLGIGRRVELVLDAGTSQHEFGADAEFLGVRLQNTLTREELTKNAHLRYLLTPFTTVGLSVRDEKIRFPFFAVKDENATVVQVEASFKPRAFISGEASLGFRRSRPISLETPAFSGLVGEVLLFKKVGEATDLGFAFSRGTGTSYDPATPYFTSKRYGVSLRRHLFRRVETWLTADRYTRGYAAFRSAASPAGADSSARYTAIVSTAVTRRARISWHMDYIGRDSKQAALRGYDGYRSGFIVSYGIFTVGNRSERGGFGPW